MKLFLLDLTIPVVIIFCLIIFLCFAILYICKTKKLKSTIKLLELEKLQNKNLLTLNDNLRGFKHDFNNIIQVIGGYISTNNMSALKTYYKYLLVDCQCTNTLSTLSLDLINNPTIYTLLTNKYYGAFDNNVTMDFEVLADLSNLNINDYELSRILGILLDNAIEASKAANEKHIHVLFKSEIKNNRVVILIENTYLDKNIDLEKIFEKGYTSKSNVCKNHGLGLWEVKKYLNRRKNLNLYTSQTDDYFRQQLEIYNT